MTRCTFWTGPVVLFGHQLPPAQCAREAGHLEAHSIEEGPWATGQQLPDDEVVEGVGLTTSLGPLVIGKTSSGASYLRPALILETLSTRWHWCCRFWPWHRWVLEYSTAAGTRRHCKRRHCRSIAYLVGGEWRSP